MFLWLLESVNYDIALNNEKHFDVKFQHLGKRMPKYFSFQNHQSMCYVRKKSRLFVQDTDSLLAYHNTRFKTTSTVNA